MSYLNKCYTLVLNGLYQACGKMTIAKALSTMCSSKDGVSTAALGLDLDYPRNEDGSINFTEPSAIRTVDIDEWKSLPLRDYDISIATAKGPIRAPIVILCPNYKKVHMRKLKANRKNIHAMYNGRSIWTGKELSLAEMSIEHLTPKSAGGDDSWLNLAPAEKHINNKRGSIPLEKWHMKPQYTLREPKALLPGTLLKKGGIPRPEWVYWL